MYSQTVLVIGATGYVGGRLVPQLLTEGYRAAYYLVHSMIAQNKKFAEADRKSAQNMVKSAADQDLERIIYLGGLGDITHPEMSEHLRSRHEVGDILQSGTVPATVFRAAMILGSGSASFEILRSNP